MLVQLSQLAATNSLSQTLGFPSNFLIPLTGNTIASLMSAFRYIDDKCYIKDEGIQSIYDRKKSYFCHLW